MEYKLKWQCDKCKNYFDEPMPTTDWASEYPHKCNSCKGIKSEKDIKNIAHEDKDHPHLSFAEFSHINDLYRQSKNKEKNSKLVKILFYPLYVVGMILLFGILTGIFAAMKKESQKSYRTSSKYKKVIKEGVLFDTTEYHEK